MPPSRRPPFVQVTVEFRVLGTLDGLTPAPPISLDPDNADYVRPGEDGVYRRTVTGNLGLIDPGLYGGGTPGSRCIPWMYLDTNGVVGELDAMFAVVDVVPEAGFPVPAGQISPLFETAGLPHFFTDRPTMVPQGSAVGITGYPSGGTEKIVRMNIVAPDDPLEWASVQLACCCGNVQCDDAPDITSSSISEYETGSVTDFTVQGDPLSVSNDNGFVSLDYALVGPGATAIIPVQVISQNLANQATLRLDSGEVPEGEYTLIAYDPFDQTCSNVNQDDPIIITVSNPPVVCPVASNVGGNVNVPAGSSGNVVQVTGTGFGSPGSPNVIDASISNGGGALTVNSVTVVNDLQVNIDYDADNAPGLYSISLFPASDECENAVLANAITVTR